MSRAFCATDVDACDATDVDRTLNTIATLLVYKVLISFIYPNNNNLMPPID